VNPVAAPWERVVSVSLQNRGIAKVEKIVERWVLTVSCDGTHSTYIDDTKFDLAHFSKGYVSARYHYVNRVVRDVKCFREPCPAITERRIALEHLAVIQASPEEERNSARQCR
jgi:transcriptional regulator of NAD metabolism